VSAAEHAIRDALSRSQQVLAETFPGFGYVIVLVDTANGDKLNYATNFNAGGLRAIGEVLVEETDEDDIPDPPEGVGVQ
jgi:hypothetical protein